MRSTLPGVRVAMTSRFFSILCAAARDFGYLIDQTQETGKGVFVYGNGDSTATVDMGATICAGTTARGCP